MENTMNIL